MRSIDLFIATGSPVSKAFAAVKRFHPDALLGPTLELFRTGRPFHIDLLNCSDLIDRLERFIRLTNDLDAEKIRYELALWDRAVAIEGDGPPIWQARPGTRAEVSEYLSELKQRHADRIAAEEGLKTHPPAEVPRWLRETEQLLYRRWEELTFDQLLPEERDYVVLWEMHAEVSNGGFDQYLFNSSGDNALLAVAALERMGWNAIRDVLLLAIEALPGGWSGDRGERWRRLDALPDRCRFFGTLNGKYDQALDVVPRERTLEDCLRAAYIREGLMTHPLRFPEEENRGD